MTPKTPKESPFSCEDLCKSREVPSEDELTALNAMREIKNRVRGLKKSLSETSLSNESGEQNDINRLKSEMAQLKVEWDCWEERRQEAAKQRMIRLGHEDG
jgi:hypothetical protein